MLTCLQALPATSQEIVLVRDTVVAQSALVFPVTLTTRFNRIVNGRSFQQWPLQTHNGFQYVAYYDQDRHLCLGRRQLPDGDWDVIRFEDYRITSNDSHNVAAIGICRGDGTIHLCFDQHADEMNYRRSVVGLATDPGAFEWDASLFDEVTNTLGPAGHVPRITYPRFFSAPNGDLMLYYRSNTSGNGDGMLEVYDATVHDWRPNMGKFIARDIGVFSKDGEQSHFRCPYLNGIWYAGDRIHVSWVWRDRFEKTSMRNNHDLCYAYSDDHGRTWHNSDGEQVGVTGASFLHLDTPGIQVASIPSRAMPRNQNAQYAYPDGSIHTVLAHRDQTNGDLVYHHHWRDASGAWHKTAMDFSGDRPKLVGTQDKQLILIYTDKDRLRIALGTPDASMSNWTWTPIFVQTAYRAGSEAQIDLSRWEQEQILSVYCQEEPSKPDPTPTPLHVTDYRFITK